MIKVARRSPVIEPWKRAECLASEPEIQPPTNSPVTIPTMRPMSGPDSRPARSSPNPSNSPMTVAARLPATAPRAMAPKLRAASTDRDVARHRGHASSRRRSASGFSTR
jgi:hypothetical protein